MTSSQLNITHLNYLSPINSFLTLLLFQIYNYALEEKKFQLSTQILQFYFQDLILRYTSCFFWKSLPRCPGRDPSVALPLSLRRAVRAWGRTCLLAWVPSQRRDLQQQSLPQQWPSACTGKCDSPSLPRPARFPLINKYLLVSTATSSKTPLLSNQLEMCFLLLFHYHVLLLHLLLSWLPPNAVKHFFLPKLSLPPPSQSFLDFSRHTLKCLKLFHSLLSI